MVSAFQLIDDLSALRLSNGLLIMLAASTLWAALLNWLWLRYRHLDQQAYPVSFCHLHYLVFLVLSSCLSLSIYAYHFIFTFLH